MRHTATQYAKVLYDLTDGKDEAGVREGIAGLLGLMERNGDLKLAKAVLERFGAVHDARSGRIEAEAVSRNPLAPETVERIKAAVRTRYGAGEVTVKNRIDESMKGGLIIRVGDEVLDGSVAGSIRKLEKALSE